MTPSFIGLMATMLPGVRPSMSLASFPTASTRPFTLLMATIDGSLTTMPFPRANTQVLAVPRSMARSLENNDSIERRLKWALLQEPGDSRQVAVDQIALAAGPHPRRELTLMPRFGFTCPQLGMAAGARGGKQEC